MPNSRMTLRHLASEMRNRMAEKSKDYWLPELPHAEDRLAEADSKLSREFLAECELTSDYVNVSRMLRAVFWIIVTAGVLAACVWGAMFL